MIVYGSQVEGETDLQVVVVEERPHVILDFIECVHLLVIRSEHVSVYLMDKDLIGNVLVEV